MIQFVINHSPDQLCVTMVFVTDYFKMMICERNMIYWVLKDWRITNLGRNQVMKMWWRASQLMMTAKNVSSWMGLILSLLCAQQRRVFISVPFRWRHLDTFTRSSFQNQPKTSNKVWMIVFKSAGCGACNIMADAWASAARELRGIVNFGVVDCMKYNRHLCGAEQIRKFPTIKDCHWKNYI